MTTPWYQSTAPRQAVPVMADLVEAVPYRPEPEPPAPADPLDLVVQEGIALEASDIHLAADHPPLLRVHGELRASQAVGVLADGDVRRMVEQMASRQQLARYDAEHELDFSHEVAAGYAARVNVYRQSSRMAVAMRLIPDRIKGLDQLGLPPVVASFAALPRGLVLVTGPTGSGKSMTLAGILDLANRTRPDHILTVEDPIEYRHHSHRCLITQREIGDDTDSFAASLRHALRQDPDIILIGEMRDPETIQTALTAAETGHLVFATLHTQDAARSVERIVDSFPADGRELVRTQLAGTLRGIVSQTLCRRADGGGRVPAVEVLLSTPAVRALIREGRQHQLYSTIHSGGDVGMQTLDQALSTLVLQGVITYETGLDKARDVEAYERLCGRAAGYGARVGVR
ncbi:type IV pilus twitching motility protein PilT [Cellulomonas sp. ACRRI]|uniref:type IV pilus twitching motility protein PilT n=1 Tax=Cellulomonas sp. ACRRI TaxID=2918188 RepID=UPI001EF2C872|nr:type IV pilus twitching motility protein PilT [Cellulomonas sp. ACRRI]MCG7287227.1 type IV pilus twitching motility protein PilT [Cellulomonas sp. ACRRI]